MSYDYDRRYAAQAIPDAATAAKVIEDALAPLFRGGDVVFKVSHARGVGIDFARMDEEAWLKKFYSDPEFARTSPENVIVSVSIRPEMMSVGWSDLSVVLANRDKAEATLKRLGISFRRAHGLTGEKAVETVVKWFRKNADALKEKALK